VGKTFAHLQFFDLCEYVTTRKLLQGKSTDARKYGDLSLVLVPGKGRPIYAAEVHDRSSRDVVFVPTRIDDDETAMHTSLATALFAFHGSRPTDYHQLTQLLEEMETQGIKLTSAAGGATGGTRYENKRLLPEYVGHFVCLATSGGRPTGLGKEVFGRFAHWLVSHLPARLVIPTPLRRAFYDIVYASDKKRLKRIQQLTGKLFFEAQCTLPVLCTLRAEQLLGLRATTVASTELRRCDGPKREEVAQLLAQAVRLLHQLPGAYRNALRSAGARNMFSEVVAAYEPCNDTGEGPPTARQLQVLTEALQHFLRTPNDEVGNVFSSTYANPGERDLVFEIGKQQAVYNGARVKPENQDLLGLVHLQQEDFHAAEQAFTTYIERLEKDKERHLSESQSLSVKAMQQQFEDSDGGGVQARNQPIYHDNFAYFNVAIACLHLGAHDRAHQHLTTFNTIMGKEKNAFFARLASLANEILVSGDHEGALRLLTADKAKALDGMV